jgi:hypothetical protein
MYEFYELYGAQVDTGGDAEQGIISERYFIFNTEQVIFIRILYENNTMNCNVVTFSAYTRGRLRLVEVCRPSAVCLRPSEIFINFISILNKSHVSFKEHVLILGQKGLFI